MKPIFHTPHHLKTHRILPGHARRSRFGSVQPLPGIDGAERCARRRTWTDRQADRRFRYGLGGSIGLVGAMLILVIATLATLGAHNVLDRPLVSPEIVTAQTMTLPVVPALPRNEG